MEFIAVIGLLASILATLLGSVWWLAQRLAHIEARLARLEETKADKADVEVIRRELADKASREDLRIELARKADKADIEALHMELAKKADKADVEVIRRELADKASREDVAGIRHGLSSIVSAASEAHRAVVDFLALKGVVEEGEARYLAERVKALFTVALPNPLTEEELRFVRDFLDRASEDPDKVTEEECERAYQIGVRLFSEDFDARGYQLAMAAAYVRAYLVSKKVREKRGGAPL